VEDKLGGWGGGEEGGELQIGVIWPCSERAVIQINGVGFRAFYLAMPLAPSSNHISFFLNNPPRLGFHHFTGGKIKYQKRY
jgi:hypothetical protein